MEELIHEQDVVLAYLPGRLRNKPDMKTTTDKHSRVCNGTRWLWGRIVKEDW